MLLRLVTFGCLPAAALLLSTVIPGAAQTATTPAKATTAAKTSGLRRLPDGHPDLQGTYDLATITPLERPGSAGAVYTPEEARKLETAAALQREKGDQSISGN